MSTISIGKIEKEHFALSENTIKELNETTLETIVGGANDSKDAKPVLQSSVKDREKLLGLPSLENLLKYSKPFGN
jgi:bacteriocin-like protein